MSSTDRSILYLTKFVITVRAFSIISPGMSLYCSGRLLPCMHATRVDESTTASSSELVRLNCLLAVLGCVALWPTLDPLVGVGSEGAWFGPSGG